MNQAVGQSCADKDGKPIDCLNGKDFTQQDLDKILNSGSDQHVAALRPYINPQAMDITADTVGGMLTKIRKHRDQLQQDAAMERSGTEQFGSIGLFTDGDIENSGYDLVYDIEQINKIIFKQPPEYDGVVNTNAPNIRDMIAGYFPENLDEEDDLEAIAETGSSLVSEERSGGFGVETGTGVGTGSTTLTSTLCPPENSYPSDFLTANFIALPAANIGSSDEVPVEVTARTPSPSFIHDTSGSGLNGFRRTGDSYSCKPDQIICIEIEFIKYTTSVGFGGGNGAGNSIEDILDQNLKIFDKYAVSSFAQARMTNNFFELSLKDINLPDMAHVGTVITKKPPPILNLGKSGTETPEDKNKKDENEIKEILARTFEAYGMDYERQNELTNPCVDQQISFMGGLGTERAASKADRTSCQPSGSAEEMYPDVKAAQMQDEYFE